jgi:lipopolysaccharide export system protein LptC
MERSMTRSLWTILFFVLAVLTSIAVWNLRSKTQIKAEGPSRSDYVLHNFEMTTLDENGKEAFTLESPYLERDPKGKTLSILTPKFKFPDNHGGVWHAESGNAWVGPKAEEVRLQDKVEMIGPKTANGQQTRFNAPELTIFPKKNTAQSTDVVTITRADSILQGRGLQVDMQAKRFQLLADVKGRYAPARR